MRWTHVHRLVEEMRRAWREAEEREERELAEQRHRDAVAWRARLWFRQYGLLEVKSQRHYYPRRADTWSSSTGGAA